MSNRNSENGRRLKVVSNTKKGVELKVHGELYNKLFVRVVHTAKNIMLAILECMDDDMNTIQIGGDTLKQIKKITMYSEQTIRDNLRVLHPIIEKTGQIRGEYIVNPTFAVKGSEELVWLNYTRINKLKSLEALDE